MKISILISHCYKAFSIKKRNDRFVFGKNDFIKKKLYKKNLGNRMIYIFVIDNFLRNPSG